MKRAIRAILLLLAFFVLSGQSPVGPFDIERLPGTRAPEFSLKDLTGNFVSLTALRGKVILLNFWATWCPPCKEEMPHLNKLHNRFKDRGFMVLSVSAGSGASQVQSYLRNSPVDYTVLPDGIEVSKLYKVYSIPTSFLIDKNGIIVERYLGQEDWASPEIIKKIEGLLK